MNRLRNSYGMGLVEILLITSVLGVILISLAPSLSKPVAHAAIENTKVTAFSARNNYSVYINHPEAWQQTVSDPLNGQLSCLSSGDCNAHRNQDIQLVRLVDPSGNEVYNRRTGLTGIDIKGDACRPADGYCIYDIDIRWTPNCTNCTGPNNLAMVSVDFEPLGRQRGKTVLNTSRYDFRMAVR